MQTSLYNELVQAHLACIKTFDPSKVEQVFKKYQSLNLDFETATTQAFDDAFRIHSQEVQNQEKD